jgi:hypothetical protein
MPVSKDAAGGLLRDESSEVQSQGLSGVDVYVLLIEVWIAACDDIYSLIGPELRVIIDAGVNVDARFGSGDRQAFTAFLVEQLATRRPPPVIGMA